MSRWKVGLVVAGLVAVAVAASRWPLAETLGALLEAARAWGPAGAVVYAGVYVVATVVGLPASLLTLGAGLVWGPVVGVAVVWPGAVVGAVVSFLIGRTVLRDAVLARMTAWPLAAALDRALASGGARLVFLLRLSPLFPFNVLNYGLGVTGVSLRHYALATAAGILPGTVVYVWIGSTVGSVAELASGGIDAGGSGLALRGVGLVATVGVTAWITLRARAELAVVLEEGKDGGNNGGPTGADNLGGDPHAQ
jgi:uncharacterized membrane protein YdjX (TVP38/TMEM64 family)